MAADRQVPLKLGFLELVEFAVTAGGEQWFEGRASLSGFAIAKDAAESSPAFSQVSMR